MKKIDLFYNGEYYCSTNQSKTCKEARQNLLDTLENRAHSFAGIGLVEEQILKNPHLLKARFDKEDKS